VQIVIQGPDRESETRVFQRRKILIGRLEDCDLVLPHPTVSKKHAEIIPEREGYLIKDLGSFNGTYVNGKWVKRARALRPGDRLKIGRYELVFLGDEEAQQVKIKPKGRAQAAAPAEAVKKEGEALPSIAQSPGARLGTASGGAETTRPMVVDLRAAKCRKRRGHRRRRSIGEFVSSRRFLLYLAAFAVAAVFLVLGYLILLG